MRQPQNAPLVRPLDPPPDSTDDRESKAWMRGVNLGGWLVLERYITPYLFSVTDCHLQGDYCWYPGQLSGPPSDSPDYKPCNASTLADAQCLPVQSIPATGGHLDYPIDEYSLGTAFLQAHGDGETVATSAAAAVPLRNAPGIVAAEGWLNHHFANFVQESDIAALAATGLTHLRVPLPHWILGHVQDDEPWIVGQRWEAFVRLC